MDVTRTVIDEVEKQTVVSDDRLVLSTGVVLLVKPIKKARLTKIMARFKQPVPPTVYIEDTGRYEVNENDPQHQQDLQRYKLELAQAINDACLVLGIEIVSVPKNLPDWNDADWLEERRLSGTSSGDSERARKLDWLVDVGASDSDYKAIMHAVGRASGTREDDVTEAAKSSGRKAARGSHNGRGR